MKFSIPTLSYLGGSSASQWLFAFSFPIAARRLIQPSWGMPSWLYTTKNVLQVSHCCKEGTFWFVMVSDENLGLRRMNDICKSSQGAGWERCKYICFSYPYQLDYACFSPCQHSKQSTLWCSFQRWNRPSNSSPLIIAYLTNICYYLKLFSAFISHHIFSPWLQHALVL